MFLHGECGGGHSAAAFGVPQTGQRPQSENAQLNDPQQFTRKMIGLFDIRLNPSLC
jgi:hypothetical protein